MFPSDLNLVVGLATFAATVGYACTRKFTVDPRPIALNALDLGESVYVPRKQEDESTTSANSPSQVLDESEEKMLEPTVHAISSHHRSNSLKRKRTHDDNEDSSAHAMEYPHNLSCIYPPKKRSRTPSSESDSGGVDAGTHANATETSEETQPEAMVSDDVDQASTPASSTSDESVEETPPPRTPEPSLPAVLQTFSTPSPVFGSSANISSPLPKASLQRSSQRAFTSNAFSAFAGSTSPFSGFKTVSTSGKPAWMTADISTSKNDVSERSNAADEDSPSLVTPSNHVLDAAIVASKTAIEHITGEENEDVSSELKGVKLFIKRGNKAFSEGMVGHVKLLSDKKTQEQRVLLRREPLWQVSMNIRMHPTVRCIFDAGENVLRLILKEAIEQKDIPFQDWKHEVVVYALKPGRSCSKQDFKDFAESVVKCAGLQEKEKAT